MLHFSFLSSLSTIFAHGDIEAIAIKIKLANVKVTYLKNEQ